MAKGIASKKTEIESLLGDLGNEIQSNDDVRALGYILAGLASSIGSAVLGSKAKKLDLDEVLERVARKIKVPKQKEELRGLAETARALAEYADLVSYDELAESEIESIESMREELSEGLWSWLGEQ